MAHVVLTAAGNTTTTTGQGTVDLIDTAPSGHGALQTIADALGDSEIASGDTVDYHLLDANGTAWESGRGTFTDDTTDTLARTTIYRSSAASDAAITLTSGTHTILFSPSAKALTAPRGHIEFDNPWFMTYSSAATTTVTVAAGRGWIDDEYLEWTTAQASGTITIPEDGGLMYVYLYNNSGTVDQDTSATAPAWNTDRGFWVKTGDTTRRCIGWVLTWEPDYAGSGGTERIVPFTASFENRRITVNYSGDHDGSNILNATDFQLVNDATNTADTGRISFDFTPPTGDLQIHSMAPEGMMTHWICAAKIVHESTSGGTFDDAILAIQSQSTHASVAAANYTYTVRASSDDPNSANKTFFGRYHIPYDGSDPDYEGQDLGGTWGVEIECWGAVAQI